MASRTGWRPDALKSHAQHRKAISPQTGRRRRLRIYHIPAIAAGGAESSSRVDGRQSKQAGHGASACSIPGARL